MILVAAVAIAVAARVVAVVGAVVYDCCVHFFG